jgi:hypothetical protein
MHKADFPESPLGTIARGWLAAPVAAYSEISGRIQRLSQGGCLLVYDAFFKSARGMTEVEVVRED